MISRRRFITGFITGLTSLAATASAQEYKAQQAGKVPRVGVIVPVEPESLTEPNVAAFRQGLRSLGYVEGQNIVIDYRYAHGKDELYPQRSRS